MTPVRHVVYLHGFASSPASSKAVRFGEALAERGVGFTCPDLNAPEFRTLTVTRMLDQAATAVATVVAGPVCLIGSSLGAFVALHAAARDRTGRVDRLVLMAPAVDFGGNRLRQLGEHGIEEWRRTGSLRIRHYALDEDRDIDFGLYEDASHYDAWAVDLNLPVLAFQGRQDDVVDPELVARWAATRPSVTLRLLEDGHQLSESIDGIVDESLRFMNLARGERC